jgi:hypothetical protein
VYYFSTVHSFGGLRCFCGVERTGPNIKACATDKEHKRIVRKLQNLLFKIVVQTRDDEQWQPRDARSPSKRRRMTKIEVQIHDVLQS